MSNVKWDQEEFDRVCGYVAKYYESLGSNVISTVGYRNYDMIINSGTFKICNTSNVQDIDTGVVRLSARLLSRDFTDLLFTSSVKDGDVTLIGTADKNWFTMTSDLYMEGQKVSDGRYNASYDFFELPAKELQKVIDKVLA